MLDKIKVNLLDLLFGNTKNLGVNADVNAKASIDTSTPKLDKDTDGFASVMNHLQGKKETIVKDTKPLEKYNADDSRKIEANKAIDTVKQVTKEIKDKLTGDDEVKPLNASKEELEPENEEKDIKELQINVMVLDTMKQQINIEIEDLTKAISSLDLSSPEGIDSILDLSDKLDALRAVEKEIELISNSKTSITTGNSNIPALELEMEKLDTKELEKIIQDKVRDLVELKVALNNQEEKPELTLGDNLKPGLETLTTNLKSIKDLKTDTELKDQSNLTVKLAKIKDVEIKEIKVDKAPIDVSIAKNLRSQERIFMDEAKVELFTEEQPEIVAAVASDETGLNAEMSDMEADSFGSNNAPEEVINLVPTQVRDTEVFKVNNKIQIHKNPVSINELPNLISREVTKASPGAKQEITMLLTPGDLGQIELSISRSGNNKIEIRMVFSQDNALNSVEHKLTELRSILRSRGFEAQIELSKSESSNTETYNQTSNNSFNEAREEQKDRILDTLPEWLRPNESSIGTSFESTLNGIL